MIRYTKNQGIYCNKGMKTFLEKNDLCESETTRTFTKELASLYDIRFNRHIVFEPYRKENIPMINAVIRQVTSDQYQTLEHLLEDLHYPETLLHDNTDPVLQEQIDNVGFND